MEIHWSRFPRLRSTARARIEARLRKLAQGHYDLIDIRLVAELGRPQQRSAAQVKISCLARGQQVLARAAHADLARALNTVIDDLERGIHRLRDRRRTLRRQPRSEPAARVSIPEALNA